MSKNWATVILFSIAFAAGDNAATQPRDVRPKESPVEVNKIAKSIGAKARADSAKYEKKQHATLAKLQPLARALTTSPALASVFLIDWLPSTEEGFRQVFGTAVAADGTAQGEIQRSRILFDGSWDSPISAAHLDALFTRIRAKHSFVVVRGHNVDGQFQIPGAPLTLDGGGQRQTFSIKEVAERCRESGLFCVFLSCGATGHLPPDLGILSGSNREITIDEALGLSALIHRRVELLKKDLVNKPGESLDQLQTFGQGISRAMNASIFGRLFVIVSEGVVVGILISDSAIECNDKDNCKPRIIRYEEARHRAR